MNLGRIRIKEFSFELACSVGWNFWMGHIATERPFAHGVLSSLCLLFWVRNLSFLFLFLSNTARFSDEWWTRYPVCGCCLGSLDRHGLVVVVCLMCGGWRKEPKINTFVLDLVERFFTWSSSDLGLIVYHSFTQLRRFDSDKWEKKYTTRFTPWRNTSYQNMLRPSSKQSI